MSRILFASVKKGHPYLEQGHWFFHESQWAICASAGHHAKNVWTAHIHIEKHDKPLPNKALEFASLDEVKQFIAGYFEDPVVDCKPSQFPKPDSL
jgi:hypothetical protein